MTDLSDLVAQVFRALKPGILESFRPLSIAAVEATQAIEYCWAAEHLTDPKDGRAGAETEILFQARSR